jgi:hypothetical protein
LKSDLIDINGVRHAETTKAVLISDDGVSENAVWLPKAHCEFEPFRGRDGLSYVKVTMPEWLAVEKGLV